MIFKDAEMLTKISLCQTHYESDDDFYKIFFKSCIKILLLGFIIRFAIFNFPQKNTIGEIN